MSLWRIITGLHGSGGATLFLSCKFPSFTTGHSLIIFHGHTHFCIFLMFAFECPISATPTPSALWLVELTSSRVKELPTTHCPPPPIPCMGGCACQHGQDTSVTHLHSAGIGTQYKVCLSAITLDGWSSNTSPHSYMTINMEFIWPQI